MADNNEPTTPGPNPEHDRPLGYWIIKAIVVFAIAGLAVFDLRTEETVPTAIYVVLAGLAGGPELAAAIRPGAWK